MLKNQDRNETNKMNILGHQYSYYNLL